jgi:DNA-binding beta-propeller fold protein YncE
MFSKRYGGFAFVAAAALGLSVGCAGGGSGIATPGAAVAPVQSAAHEAFLDSGAVARATKIVAVSDDEDNAVIAYDPSGHVLTVLSDFNFPQGLANDINGDLYVADQLNSRIQIYAPGFKGKPKTLSDPGQYPMSVDSFANGKYVAVVNQYTTSYGPGSVTMYTDGVAGAPITSPSIAQAFFAAFDAKGNLYVDFSPKGDSCPCLGEIANATNGGTTLALLTTSNSIHPGGIQVTTTGQIAIFDQGSNTVYTYNAPSGGSLGSPVAHAHLAGSLDAPAEFAFTSDMKNLYVANNSDNNSVYEFAYPAGGKVSSISVGGLPFGVALFPKQFSR